METLDLHGVRHHQVEGVVENFILLQQSPARIITGNSPSMKILVQKVLDRCGFSWDYENDYNMGSIVVVSTSI